jgi:hypothetical protein
MSGLPNFGGPASQRIWSLVSGVPAWRREARKLLMLQAFMDESQDDEYFVMADYISSVPKWAAFSDEWDKLLNHGMKDYPRLEEFHMNEMFGTPERMEMVPWFYKVIESHVECALSFVVNVKELREEFDKFPWPDWLEQPEILKNPYLLGFKSMFEMLRFFKADLGITEKVDFFFDKRLGDEEQCKQGWKIMSEDSVYRDLCGEDPWFRDSKLTLPIQAADFFAYWVREWKQNGEEPTSGNLPFPWWEAKEDIPTMSNYTSGAGARDNWTRWVARTEAQRRGIEPPPDEAPTFERA